MLLSLKFSLKLFSFCYFSCVFLCSLFKSTSLFLVFSIFSSLFYLPIFPYNFFFYIILPAFLHLPFSILFIYILFLLF